MGFLSNSENIPFFLTIVFAWLWYRTPVDSTYETVELETVSTRWVFFILATTCFGFWLAIRFYW